METATPTYTVGFVMQNDFATHLKAHGKNVNTIRVYMTDLRLAAYAIVDACPDNGFVTLEDLTPAVIDAALSGHLFTHTDNGTPAAPATLHRRKAALRAFLSYTDARGLTNNLAAAVKLPRVEATPPTFLTEEECRRLLRTLRERNVEHAFRDRVMIELFLGTGIRLAELTALNTDDINMETKHLRLKNPKGGQPQVKFLKTSLRALLRKYLQWRNRIAAADEPALFLSNRGTRISPRQIAYRVEEWVREAGVNKEVTPHSLRHSFATHLYRKTGDVLMVQKALGHKSVATSTIYTHLVDDDLENAIEFL